MPRQNDEGPSDEMPEHICQHFDGGFRSRRESVEFRILAQARMKEELAYQDNPPNDEAIKCAILKHLLNCTRQNRDKDGIRAGQAPIWPTEGDTIEGIHIELKNSNEFRSIPIAIIQDVVDTMLTDRQLSAKGTILFGQSDPQLKYFVSKPAHSPDFRSVKWYGKVYHFTALQAACVAILWKAWTAGVHDVGDATLLEAADSRTSRLVNIFRNCPAWGSMIVRGETKGIRRLACEPNNS